MSVYLHRSGLLGGGAVAGAGAAFSPADLFGASELGAYWDISDTSTLWQDTGATSPVTADGQSVARVDDLSGNGRNLLQSTASKRPVYRTSGGLHWLEFDGSTDVMVTGTIGSPVTGPSNGGAIFSVYTMNDAEALANVLIEQDTGDSARRTALYSDTRTTPNRFLAYSPDGSTSFLNYSAEQAADTRSAIANYDGSTWTGYKDGSSIGTLSDSAGFIVSTFRFELGGWETASLQYFNGDFFGGGLIDKELTASEISDLDAWQRGLAGI